MEDGGVSHVIQLSHPCFCLLVFQPHDFNFQLSLLYFYGGDMDNSKSLKSNFPIFEIVVLELRGIYKILYIFLNEF